MEKLKGIFATVSGLGGPAYSIWTLMQNANSIILFLSGLVGLLVGVLSLAWWVRKWYRVYKKLPVDESV